jgi:hypothetical protein
MALTSSMAVTAAAVLMALLPVVVRTLGWLLGLRMVLRASRPDERPALLAAFAPVSATLQNLGRTANEPDARRSRSGMLEGGTGTACPHETQQGSMPRSLV